MLRAKRDLARARLAARDGKPEAGAAFAGLRQQSTPYHLTSRHDSCSAAKRPPAWPPITGASSHAVRLRTHVKALAPKVLEAARDQRPHVGRQLLQVGAPCMTRYSLAEHRAQAEDVAGRSDVEAGGRAINSWLKRRRNAGY